MQEIEIEYKNILTKKEYDQLVAQYFQKQQPIKQVNYYFDTSSFDLAKNRYALRIREKNEQYILTLKQPHEAGILETHEALTKTEVISLLTGKSVLKPKIAKQLNEINVLLGQVVYYGNLTTYRLETTIEQITLVLDHSVYNNNEDFEIEIEAPSKELGLLKITEILKGSKIKKRTTKTKSERFFFSLPPEISQELKSTL